MCSVLLIAALLFSTLAACKNEQKNDNTQQEEQPIVKEFNFRTLALNNSDYDECFSKLLNDDKKLQKNANTNSFYLSEQYDIHYKNNSLYLKDKTKDSNVQIFKGKVSAGQDGLRYDFECRINDTKFLYSCGDRNGVKYNGIYDIEKETNILLESWKDKKRIAANRFLLKTDDALYFYYHEIESFYSGEVILTTVDLSFLQTGETPQKLNEKATTYFTDLPKNITNNTTNYMVSPDGKYCIILAQDTYREKDNLITPTIYIYSLETQKEVHKYELKQLPVNEDSFYYNMRFINESELYVYDTAYSQSDTQKEHQYLHYIVTYK